MTRALLARSAVSLLLLELLRAQPAFADHESRDWILSDTGIEVILFALVVFAALVAITAFAAGILWWERQDEKPDRDEPS